MMLLVYFLIRDVVMSAHPILIRTPYSHGAVHTK